MVNETNKDIFAFNKTDERTHEYYNFDENPVLEGFLIDLPNGAFGVNYLIEQRETKKLVVVGSKTSLKDKITREDIGSPIRIEFLGLEKSNKIKGQVYQKFKVFIKKL